MDAATRQNTIGELNERYTALETTLRKMTRRDPRFEEVNDEKWLVTSELRYLSNPIDSLPVIRKGNTYAGHRAFFDGPYSRTIPFAFYSLWIGSSPVVHIEEGKPKVIMTTSKSRPFKISDHFETGIWWRYLAAGKKYDGVGEGSFIDQRAHPLTPEGRDISKKIFDQVRSGIPIFPAPETPFGYRGKKEKKEKKSVAATEDAIPRTEGQAFLETLNPEKVIPGVLFGNGTSYKAYHFGPVVVVESDEANHATYLLGADDFETLRQRPRSELIRVQPAGFLGREIHKDSSWETSLLESLLEKV